MKYYFIISLCLLLTCHAVDNGLGKTPQMGWNTWNKFGCKINEDLIRATADTLVESGLAKAGYIHLNLDDCWQKSRDPVTGRILVDKTSFPSGIESLISYIHSKGLKFGLYSDAGYKTCAGRPGSYGYEEIDALQYSEWDVDYLKYDNCFHDGTSPLHRYPIMSSALAKQQKKIFFSMCEWGVDNPAEWAGQHGNSWRTTVDIDDTWKSFTSILDQQVGLEKYAGPGGWNDPDMLEVGNGGMTTDEYQAHFALWALLKAPLLIGCDINKMSEATKNILLNEEIIAVNQDSLGKQGTRVQKNGDLEVWAGQVQDGGDGVVVVLFNRSYKEANISIDFSTLKLSSETMNVRCLIHKKDKGLATKSFSANVPAHGSIVVKLTQPNDFIQ